MANDKVISTLNKLIETCKDGEEGFRRASEGLQDSRAKSLFLQYSRQRAQMARELQEQVRKLGGDPARGGSISGTMHRGWMNIRSVVSGKDDTAIIAEAERGEDSAKQAYEEALKEELPPSIRALVEQQSALVREAHDRVRAIEKPGARH